jgi:uncharacterized protein YkwD
MRSTKLIPLLACAGLVGCAADGGSGGNEGGGQYLPTNGAIPDQSAMAGGAALQPMQGGLPMVGDPMMMPIPEPPTGTGAPPPPPAPEPEPLPPAPEPGSEPGMEPIQPPPVEEPVEEPVEDPGLAATDEIPATEHCMDAVNWDPMMTQFEDEVLLLVNERRMAGATCGGQTRAAVPPLSSDGSLRCAARLHSTDMSVQDYFDHNSLDGRDPGDRVNAAGFVGSWVGENIAYGQSSPQQVMDGWMQSDGHCNNIMQENYLYIGVGAYQGPTDPNASRWQQARIYWTQNFGGAARGGGGFGGF